MINNNNNAANGENDNRQSDDKTKSRMKKKTAYKISLGLLVLQLLVMAWTHTEILNPTFTYAVYIIIFVIFMIVISHDSEKYSIGSIKRTVLNFSLRKTLTNASVTVTNFNPKAAAANVKKSLNATNICFGILILQLFVIACMTADTTSIKQGINSASASAMNMMSSALGSDGLSSSSSTSSSSNTVTSTGNAAAATATTADANKKGSGSHQFIRYESSKWEKEWIQLIFSKNTTDQLTLKTDICNKMTQDRKDIARVQTYMNQTCNTFDSTEKTSPWCKIDDFFKPIFYHRLNGQVTQNEPSMSFDDMKTIQQIQTFHNNHDADIFSRFVYWDSKAQVERYEYIEPLVGYLRHPLTCCETKFPVVPEIRPYAVPSKGVCHGYMRQSRTYFMYPPPSKRWGNDYSGDGGNDNMKHYYFDFGAVVYQDMSGNSAGDLSYFYENFQKFSNIQFDKIYAWGATPTPEFRNNIPNVMNSQIEYNQRTGKYYFNTHIERYATPNDYVFVKLDTTTDDEGRQILDYMMDKRFTEAHLKFIDEFVYDFPWPLEHEEHPLSEYYKSLLFFRNHGVRTHSWVRPPKQRRSKN